MLYPLHLWLDARTPSHRERRGVVVYDGDVWHILRRERFNAEACDMPSPGRAIHVSVGDEPHGSADAESTFVSDKIESSIVYESATFSQPLRSAVPIATDCEPPLWATGRR